MKWGGGIVSFEIEGGLEVGRAFLDKLKLFSLSANLGDTRSIATHPAYTTHSNLTPEQRAEVGISDGLIRLSKVLPFTEHEDVIRRRGCISTIKNCCFDVEDPSAGGLLLSEELNILPYILLPLCGNEDYDDDVSYT